MKRLDDFFGPPPHLGRNEHLGAHIVQHITHAYHSDPLLCALFPLRAARAEDRAYQRVGLPLVFEFEFERYASGRACFYMAVDQLVTHVLRAVRSIAVLRLPNLRADAGACGWAVFAEDCACHLRQDAATGSYYAEFNFGFAMGVQ